MTRLFAALILVAALDAAAQTILTPSVAFRRVDDTTSDTFTFGAGQCNDSITVRWTNTTAISFVTTCSSNSMKVWSTAGECANTPGTADLRYDDIPGLTLQSIKQGSFNVKLSELPGFDSSLTTDGGVVTCGTAGITKNHKLCGAIEYTTFTGISCGTATTYTASAMKLVYDTEPPSAPSITDSAPQDQGVKVIFSANSDVTSVVLEVMAMGESDYRQIAETTTTGTTTILGKNLLNGTTYDVRIRGKDAAGNVSEPSTSVAITPIKTLGFYGFYRQAGGTDAGCSTAPGFISLLGALWLWRRRTQRNGSSS